MKRTLLTLTLIALATQTIYADGVVNPGRYGPRVQKWNANLDTYEDITPSANVQSILGAATYAAINTLLGTGSATDPNLTGFAAFNWTEGMVPRKATGDTWVNAIDDTKGNGDTTYLWSADKNFDQLALKAPLASPMFTTNITTPAIKPAADSTTAIQLFKADGATQVGAWDTTNSRLIVGTGTSTADFAVKPDTDVTGIIGRAVISSSPLTDRAFFSHYDRNTIYDYGILHDGAGLLSLNASSSRGVYLSVDGSASTVLDGATGNFGVGTTVPWSKLSVDGGDLSVRDSADLGSERFSETAFATHANWDVTGSAVDSGGNVVFSGAGTLTQTIANMVGARGVVPGKMYLFGYTVSGVSGSPAATITTAIASSATALTLTAGAKTVMFQAAAAPGSFVINATAGTFTLDDVSLKPVGGDAIAEGYLIGGGLKLQAVTITSADSPYTPEIDDYAIYANATGGNIVISVPDATWTGRVLFVKKTDASANTITLTGTGGATIDGAASQVLATQNDGMKIQDGAVDAWYIN